MGLNKKTKPIFEKILEMSQNYYNDKKDLGFEIIINGINKRLNV
ncbi:MAG: hypothetical protein US50_C0050G0011 [Candidatus Nomurabacteria bacterium GW2011_GWB1_37_5]|uniref:Uncharacterized protein n=1 Tax=Candidatus Nomurabacteria bacterium GW2011_GWB1_37_5 TaxID=1618742 RepID=A0A0G0GTM3_9BACT|nr:MAG: hypothetical protein US50_C0050G0011 [Candidatus Nomurabacteria bacterium GW2011_GWB1_37_5]